MFFESFLSNNIKFGSLNEVVTFIDNVTTEVRQYDDKQFLDEDISLEDAYHKVMCTCGFEWIPTKKEMKIVWDIMKNLSQTDLNRLFYKNNLFGFCDNKSITKALTYILQKLDVPFLDPNKPPKEIKVELEGLLDIFKEYVYYHHQIIDKMDRVKMMIRDVTLITDTDSCIVSLDAWYNYVLEKIQDVPMKVKKQLTNPIIYFKRDEFGDLPLRKAVTHYEPEYDYNFFSDEVIQIERLRNPVNIIPQDALRHSIINIIAYIMGKLILDYMEKFTMNYNSYSPERKCLLVMKNEYLFKSILMTDGKKNYAAIQELQEGNPVPEDKSLAIAGLPIDKVGLQAKTREQLQKVLYEDVLKPDEIDQINVMKKIILIEKDIYNSLTSGKKEYYKPVSVKSMNSYENPMSIQGIKAAYVYNELRDEHTDAIDLDKRNRIDIIKVDIDPKSALRIIDKYPEKYEKIMKLMEMKAFSVGIDSIGLPLNVDVPEWVLDFIDYKTIINDNVKNFPLDSIGLHRMDNSRLNYTNILKV